MKYQTDIARHPRPLCLSGRAGGLLFMYDKRVMSPQTGTFIPAWGWILSTCSPIPAHLPKTIKIVDMYPQTTNQSYKLP